MSGDEEGYEIVMPFVSVVSVGGPHDDEAYAAGWEMGKLQAHLDMAKAIGCIPSPRLIKVANLRQADLLAMAAGFRMERSGDMELQVDGETVGETEWTFVLFLFHEEPEDES